MSVYFISDSRDRVKIGYSSKPDKRLCDLQSSHADELYIFRVIEGVGYPTERWLHRKFKSQRITGEWFHFVDEMLTVVPPDELPQHKPDEKVNDDGLTYDEWKKQQGISFVMPTPETLNEWFDQRKLDISRWLGVKI